MTVTHLQRIFQRAWAEHQQIRLILVEIKAMLGQRSHVQQQRADEASDIMSEQNSYRLLDLINQLSRRFAYEGANGEVAITLACDRHLHSDVADLTSRWKKLDRELRDLIDVYTDCEDLEIQIEHLGKAFPQLSHDIASYLPDKMDALRKSLVSVRELVTLSG